MLACPTPCSAHGITYTYTHTYIGLQTALETEEDLAGMPDAMQEEKAPTESIAVVSSQPGGDIEMGEATD